MGGFWGGGWEIFGIIFWVIFCFDFEG